MVPVQEREMLYMTTCLCIYKLAKIFSMDKIPYKIFLQVYHKSMESKNVNLPNLFKCILDIQILHSALTNVITLIFPLKGVPKTRCAIK